MSGNESLVDMIKEKLNSQDVDLPVFDLVAKRVYDETQREDFNVNRLVGLMEKDPALTSEVLKVANSNFYKGLGDIADLNQAVVRLGAKQISSLACAAGQKRIYSASEKRFRVRLLKLWRHASAAALTARWVAQKAGYFDQADQAFVAGLLHDVGKVSLLRIIEDIGKEQETVFSDHVIDMTLLALYCEHGDALLESWSLPDSLRSVVLGQAAEEFDESNVLLAIVRLVDKACAKEGVSDLPDSSICLETTHEAELLGLNPIQLAEMQLLIEDASTTL